MRCMVYIDLNMVRDGVVNHPEKWKDSGFNEIQKPPKRYAINRLVVERFCGCERFSKSAQPVGW